MMIDAHVHAFPRVVPGADKLIGRLARLAKPLLGIEGVAAVQKQAGPLGRYLETASSLALLPPLFLGGTTAGLLSSMDEHGIAYVEKISQESYAAGRKAHH